MADAIDEILARASAPPPPSPDDDPELSFLRKGGGDAIDAILARATAAPPAPSPTFRTRDGRVIQNFDADQAMAELHAAAASVPKPTAASVARDSFTALAHAARSGYRAGSRLAGLPTLDDLRAFRAASGDERTATLLRAAPNLIPGVASARTLLDPTKRRELERGIDDSVTLGYGQRLADKLARTAGAPEADMLATTAPSDAAAAPDFRPAGSLIGMALPGASALAGKGAGAVGRVIGPGPASALGQLGAGAVKAAAGYEATAPILAALAANSEGHRVDAALQAAGDPAGLATSIGLGGASAGAKRAIETSRGARAARFVEEAGQGAQVGPTTPGEGGVFDRELAGVPANDRGIGTAAKRAGKQLVDEIAEQHRVENSRPYQAMKAAIDRSPAANARRDITPIVQQMQDAAYDLETAPPARAALAEQLKLVERYRDPQTGNVMIPEQQLNGLRRSLMRVAKVGMTDAPGEAEAPLRQAAFAAKAAVDQGPYRLLNDFYATGAKENAARRILATGRARPRADVNVDYDKARLMLARGEPAANSATAGALGADRLNELRALAPNLIPTTDLPSLARARAELAFRLEPQHGGLMARAGAPGARLAFIQHALKNPVSSAIGAASLNAAPIQGRFLAPLARLAPSPETIGQRLARAIAASRTAGADDQPAE